MQPKFRLNAEEFNRTLRQYAQVSKRTVPEILNTKGYFIARRATVETPKASKEEIETELGKLVTVPGVTKSGKAINRRVLQLVASRKGAPLAALIVQKRRRAKGLRGLEGKPLEKAIRKMIAARKRSIAFLKSGWLPAIRKLALFAEKRGAPPTDKAAKERGQPKGYAKEAVPAWLTRCIIANTAGEGAHANALRQYGGPALQRAFDAETRSMREYMAKKLGSAAKRIGIKTSG